MKTRINNRNKFLLLSEEELEKIKTVAEYLFMDQYQDTCSYPRFEECFGGFTTDEKSLYPRCINRYVVEEKNI